MPVRKKKNGGPKKETDKRYARLSWSLPPHSPVNMCFLVFFTGLTSKPRHAHESLKDSLTWIPLPATGLDFQPQTRAYLLSVFIQFPYLICRCRNRRSCVAVCPLSAEALSD